MRELKAHKARQAQEKLLCPAYEDNKLVFCRSDGKLLHPDYFTKHFQRLLKRAGLERARPHDLRHTFATLLLKAGEHPKVVQELLSHSSITMTLDTYSHVVPGLKEKASQSMDTILRGLGTKRAPIEPTKKPSVSRKA